MLKYGPIDIPFFESEVWIEYIDKLSVSLDAFFFGN